MERTTASVGGQLGAPLGTPESRDVGELIAPCHEAEPVCGRIGMLNERLGHICDQLFGPAPSDTAKQGIAKAVPQSTLGRLSDAQSEAQKALNTADFMLERFSRLV